MRKDFLHFQIHVRCLAIISMNYPLNCDFRNIDAEIIKLQLNSEAETQNVRFNVIIRNDSLDSNYSLNSDCARVVTSLSHVKLSHCRSILRYLGVFSLWHILTCSSYWHRSGMRACQDFEGRTCSFRRWRSSGSAFFFHSSAWLISSHLTAWSVKL